MAVDTGADLRQGAGPRPDAEGDGAADGGRDEAADAGLIHVMKLMTAAHTTLGDLCCAILLHSPLLTLGRCQAVDAPGTAPSRRRGSAATSGLELVPEWRLEDHGDDGMTLICAHRFKLAPSAPGGVPSDVAIAAELVVAPGFSAASLHAAALLGEELGGRVPGEHVLYRKHAQGPDAVACARRLADWIEDLDPADPAFTVLTAGR